MIPEAQNPISLSFEIFAAGIVLLCRMLASIDLNDQRTFGAYKIDDERTNGRLASELETFKLTIAQNGTRRPAQHPSSRGEGERREG